MHQPAFALPSLPSLRRHARNKGTTPLRMTIIPRPMGEMPSAAVYKRSQGREVTTAPIFTSDLDDAATSYLFCPTKEFASFALRLLFGQSNIFEAEMEALIPGINRLLISGDVRQFVREIAKSDSFRARFFDGVNSLRFIEVCYKNLLARAPYSQAEISEKIELLNNEGYDAFIDSLVDSDEYAQRFGSSVLPNLALSGSYVGGMPSFNAQMKLQLTTRGATAESLCSQALTTSVLAGKNAAAPVELAASYEVNVPKYEGVMDWNDWHSTNTTFMKDWASACLLPSKAIERWTGLGSPRPTGVAKGPWEPGWSPMPTGEKWKPGWTAPAPKSYR